MAEIFRFPARQVINPLLSMLYETDPHLKWRTVQATGVVVSVLAESNLESARVIMRRLLWQLNDESGGIGWGSAEALAETMAKSSRLAREYATILVSFIDPGQNFIEHEPLQKGILWGLGRLGQVYPNRVRDAAPHLIRFLKSPDPEIRGLAARAAAVLDEPTLKPYLTRLAGDPTQIHMFIDGEWTQMPISELALNKNPSAS